tara:strand:+ start:534 stop:782 length:249 start_codon:yes stop_codon:yes gene_type:complete
MEIEWAKNLENIHKQVARLPDGDGWFTAEQFMQKTGTGRAKSYKIIKQMQLDGKMEHFQGSDYNPQLGHNCRRVWYRFINTD